MNRGKFHHNTSLLLTALLLIGVYYVADMAMDAWVFGEGHFLEQLLHPSPHEIGIRLLSSVFILLFFFTAALLLRKNRRLQRDILAQSQELISAQQQLQDYHFTVSHQLRTSLTCVATAEQLLREQRPGRLKLDHALLDSIHDSCWRMSEQIDHMLDLSRARSTALNRQQVDLEALVREASQELVTARDDVSIRVALDAGLTAECDLPLMAIALRNIFEGLVALCAPAVHTTLVVGQTAIGDQRAFFVRNLGQAFKDRSLPTRLGAGAPPLEANREQLSPLALARLIIHRHGGRLWADPHVESGSAFFFTLHQA